MATKREAFNFSEPNDPNSKAPFWCSVRMTYFVCGFLSMVLHHCMRSAVNTSILCMISDEHYTELNYTKEEFEQSQSCKEMYNHTDKAARPHGDLDWTRTQEVMFQGLFYYGYIASMPIGGLLSDRYGGKILFVYSIVVEAVLFLLIPVSARLSFWLAGAVRILQGIVAGLGNPALYTLFTVWAHPTERTAALAFGYSGFNVGNLIVAPLCSFLCQFGWEVIFYVVGAISFVVSLSFQWLVYNTIDQHPRISKREYDYLKAVQKPETNTLKLPWCKILKSLPVYMFFITHFCHTFGASIEAMMLSRYLKEALFFPVRWVGSLSAIIFLGSFVSKISTIIYGFKFDSMDINHNKWRKIIHFTCCLIALVLAGVIAFLTCHDRWVIVGLWTIVTIFTDIAFSLAYWPSVITMAPSYAGFLIGTANCFGTTSAVVIPIIIAKVAPLGAPHEWQHIIAIMAAVYFIDAIAFGAFGSSLLQPWGLVEEEKKSSENTEKAK